MTAAARRQILQTEITTDAVLQMHDQIAFFQIGEINVERRTGRQRVRRFLAARTLDFVTAKNLRIRDDDQLCFVTNEAASERTKVQRRTGVAPVSNFFFSFFRWRQARRLSYKFSPNLLKPLALAVVVAKDVNGIILPQPAMELLEKFAPLRLGNLRFGRALSQRTEGVERSENRSVELRFGQLDVRLQPIRRTS